MSIPWPFGQITAKLGKSSTQRLNLRQAMNTSNEMDQHEVLRVKLAVLRREHRDLDDAIHALEDVRRTDQLRLRRLKKQKLLLKDKIAQVEDQLTPDIIA